MATVRSLGKGRAGDGFVVSYWELHTARPFRPSLTIVCSSAMGCFVNCIRWCHWRCSGEISVVFSYISFIRFVSSFRDLTGDFVSFILDFGICSCSGRAPVIRGGVMIRWLGHRDALWVPVYRTMLGGSSVWSRSGCNIIEHDVEGVYNAVLW